MGMAYSKDIRLRAAKAMMAGEPSRQVAARFGVGASSVMRWRRLLVATQDVGHGKLGGHRKPVLAAHSDFILQSLETTPHLTLSLLAAMLEKRGVTVTPMTVWNHLRRHKLSFKKNAIRAGTEAG
jgi:putative transposase